MPSKSPAQHRLMEAAAHTPGGYGGVPQSVGKDFAAADEKRGADHARANQAKTKGAENNAAGHAKQMHEQGAAHGAKHGG